MAVERSLRPVLRPEPKNPVILPDDSAVQYFYDKGPDSAPADTPSKNTLSEDEQGFATLEMGADMAPLLRNNPIARLGYDPEIINYKGESTGESAYYRPGFTRASDEVVYSEDYGSSPDIISHEFMHRGWKMLLDLNKKIGDEAFKEKYGLAAITLLQALDEELAVELRDDPDATWTLPFEGSYENEDSERRDNVRQMQSTIQSVDPAMLRDYRHVGYYDPKIIPNGDLFNRGYEGLDRAANDLLAEMGQVPPVDPNDIEAKEAEKQGVFSWFMSLFEKEPAREELTDTFAEMALGGLATARRGITTQEGEDMANNKVQLDRKKADANKDGKVSKYEELSGEAKQLAMVDDPDQDEKVKMSHGGMAMMGDYGEGLMSNYDPVSGNPIPLGSSAENVRDDIDAKISTDEYVLPAHVVKWHGLKHIMEMQSEAEMGLMSMDMSGLIQEVGGEEDEYADHMMYDPQTGEGRMTTSYEDHLDLKNQGWDHESDAQEKPDSEGSEDAQVSDASGSEQEEKETLETPEGNQIEVAGVETTLIEPEVDETEDYKKNKYGKSTGSFGIKKNPSVAFIM